MSITLREYQHTLLSDTRLAMQDGYRRILLVLGCGGGKTVCFAWLAASAQAKGKCVWFLVPRREILKQTIETFDRFGIVRQSIHIDMAQTIARSLHKYPAPDVIVFDEAHLSEANTWQKIVKEYPDAHLIGLTGSPERLDGKPLSNTYETLVQGPSTRELIELGYLSKYKAFAPSIADLSGLRRKGKDYDQEHAAELLSGRAIYGDVLRTYDKLAHGVQSICYCPTILHSKNTSKEFRNAGFNAVHFDGDTPQSDRDNIVRDFRRGEIKILCNVDLVSMGFDCPDVDCGMLMRPTDSLALYVQQSQRPLRHRHGKTATILDFTGNIMRHGMPDEPHEWSLTGRVKYRQYNVDGTLRIRQCNTCFFTFPTAPVCPNCGASYVVTRNEIQQIKEVELQEIKARKDAYKDKYKEDVELRVSRYTTDSECRNLSELQAFAKRTGRKSGWAWHMARVRGMVKA